MNFLISDAYAQQAVPDGPNMAGLVFPLAILAVFYFLFIRPQQRRAKEHKKMLEALTKGSEVVTNGGLLGKVVSIDENFVQIEVSEGVLVHVQRHAVANLMPKGTYKGVAKEIKPKSSK